MQHQGIDTDPSLGRERFVRDGTIFDYPFFGAITLTSDDGSVLILAANGDVRPGDSLDTVLLNSEFYPNSGGRVEAKEIVFKSPAFEAPNCAYARNFRTGKVACNDGGSFYIP